MLNGKYDFMVRSKTLRRTVHLVLVEFFLVFFRQKATIQNKISEEHFELLLYKLNYLFFPFKSLKQSLTGLLLYITLRIKAQKYYSQKKSLKEPTFVVARPIDQCGLYPGSPPRLVIQISSVTRLNS